MTRITPASVRARYVGRNSAGGACSVEASLTEGNGMSVPEEVSDLERTARVLASELSRLGERDWHRYVGFARRVRERIDPDMRRVLKLAERDR